MKIRNAFVSDSNEIAVLATELGYRADTDEIRRRLARLVERADQLILVAILDEKVEGWMHARASFGLESATVVEIVSLVVSWRCRRRGAGGCLLRRAELWGNDLQATAVLARSDTKRPEGHGFFPAVGYTLAKTQALYQKQLRQGSEPSA